MRSVVSAGSRRRGMTCVCMVPITPGYGSGEAVICRRVGRAAAFPRTQPDGDGAIMDVLWLSKADVRRLLDPRALLDALSQGFADLSAGKLVCPDRPELTVPGAGFLLPMAAWQAGKPMAVKLVTVFEGNLARGLPSHLALICLFDPTTGAAIAVMDGKAITAMRTAGSAAV